jgi:hypothetical protein
MGQAINTAVQLGSIRAKIDLQQQLVSGLENELQQVIIGGRRDWKAAYEMIDNVYGLPGPGNPYSDLIDAMNEGIENLGGELGGPAETDELDQGAIRHMLYQARALLGELRVEEQHWNLEVNEEKSRRKDLGEFAKG